MEELKMKEYVASPSNIAFQSNKEYDVFLSFRGDDVRKNLVDHLYEALTVAGVNAFLDSHKLEKGEIIGLTLERAVESSAIRIPIFSEKYADSTWCLREAAAMLKTPGLIIPLFYHVLPTHVRYPLNQSSPYKQAFQKYFSHSHHIEWWKYALQQICPCLSLCGHSGRHSSEEIDGWKKALEEICARSGWSMDLTGRFEAQLVKRVVNDVLKTLDRVQLEVAKHPVGLETVTHDLIHKFKLNSKEGVVKAGLLGIGGIGKTTAAKAIYNQVYGGFDSATSFVRNVRATAADATGLAKLQTQILKDITNYSDEVSSVDKGTSLLTQHLGGKRLLLILDDVDDKKQLDALAGFSLAPGSRLIITTRNRHILHLAGVSDECIHEMSGLQINESLQLFSWHAFLRESPMPGFEDLSRGIVEACRGHPLSLEVIGALLYDKHDRDCWKEAAGNITLNQDIHETLNISYTALSAEEKEIFLDIACFFIGENKSLPIIFWKSLYKSVHIAISNLSLKLLIKIDEKGVFDMHDHLRDMGRTIAEQGTRLWERDHLSTVSTNINFSRLRLEGGDGQSLQTLYTPGLRFLHLKNLRMDTPPILPSSLIWLRMKLECSSAMKETFQFSLPVDNILQLKILQICGDFFNFHYSLSNILGKLSQLQHLNLRKCRNLNNLPDSIGNLSQLQHLDLSYCENLNNLPDSIGNLSQLQHLNLFNCTNLNNLPDSIGNLSQLQHLKLSSCVNLKNLPDSIGNLSQLQIVRR